MIPLGCPPPPPPDDPEFVVVVVVGFGFEATVVGFVAEPEFEFELPVGFAGEPALQLNLNLSLFKSKGRNVLVGFGFEALVGTAAIP